MKGFDLLLRGIAAGLAISAPVGPVNVLCISRTITNGGRAGVISGLGAAAADTIYGAIAGFSITFIIGFLIKELFWLRLFGGILLIAIGIRYYFKQPQPLDAQPRKKSAHSDLVSAMLLNLTNPTTVLSFLAVLAVLGLGQRRSYGLSLILVLGIFAGSMLWWILLAALANYFRGRFNQRSMVWMNRIAALAIGGFGVITMLMARGSR
jgi:threonine/homoserine/homoserine lactone efflux protein